MTFTEVHTVTLTKAPKRLLTESVIRGNIQEMLISVNNKSLKAAGWTLDTESDVYWNCSDAEFGREDFAKYIYQVSIRVSYNNSGKPADKWDLARIVKTVHTRASAPAYGKWNVTALDGEPYTPSKDDDKIGDTKEMVQYAPVVIPEDFNEYFSHLYGLDAHITRVRMALEAAIMSDFTNRYHVALAGPPGCGKSDLCRSLKRALGDDAVMEFDATAMTKAGAQKELLEREILPRVLIIEEIEKAPSEEVLSFLLSLCDQRGEIRKVTARENIVRDTKLFVIATVNNVELFRKLQAGALASRFSNTVWFKRPSADLLGRILYREVTKVHGDIGWIAPALTYCASINDTDPRSVTATCLCGREKLISGEWQRLMADTSEPEPVTTDRTF